jgi:nicotinate-nucleotide pyrophosphorylase (carboxylating)
MDESLAISWKQVEQIVDAALAEDLGSGDITTEILISPELRGRASIVVKGEGVLAGLEVAAEVFHRVDASLKFNPLIPDGTEVHPGDIVATIEGSVAGILKVERTALNFLQHLSGIATETARYVRAVKGLKARITDTRKTIPGLRLLEKYAVHLGGGLNHRHNLGSGILIKDNHLAALKRQGIGLREAVERAHKKAPHTLKVEVEVESWEQACEALEAGAEVILVDNMSLDEIRRVVEICQGQAIIEASGGITLENVRAVAETGVDLISIGALTHSAKALDISLELEPPIPEG